MEICEVCGENETARLMDLGGGKKVPICTDCLTLGKWLELLPKKPETEPEPLPYAPETAVTPSEPTLLTEGTNDLECSVCGRVCKSAFGLKSHMRTHK